MRVLEAIAGFVLGLLSLCILLGFQLLIAPHMPQPPHQPVTAQGQQPPQSPTAPPQGSPGTAAAAAVESLRGCAAAWVLRHGWRLPPKSDGSHSVFRIGL